MSYKRYFSGNKQTEEKTKTSGKPGYFKKKTCPPKLGERRGKKYRVKSPIKSFRDLEVYQKTTELAVEIYKFMIPKKYKQLQDEWDILKNLSKNVPKLIAEANGDKFTNINIGLQKLEHSAQVISDIITKLDFFLMSVEETEPKDEIQKFLKKYQVQRTKILNLKRAWSRVFVK